MRRRRALTVLTSAALLGGCLGGCASLFGGSAEPRPLWVQHPPLEGVVAAAGRHLHGGEAQEALALARGRAALARRLDVPEAELRMAVRERWLEPGTGLLWLWLVPAP
jgi:hypothetical protein